MEKRFIPQKSIGTGRFFSIVKKFTRIGRVINYCQGGNGRHLGGEQKNIHSEEGDETKKQVKEEVKSCLKR